MLFNSISFIIFFICFFHLYWILNNRTAITYRNLFVLCASYFFYGCWDWRFLGLLWLSSTTDFFLGKYIAQAQKSTQKKALLFVSIVFNLGILGFFKYFNFFVSSFQDLLALTGLPINTFTLTIILPVGISFYTFQSLSYTIDVYRNKLEPEKNILTFLSFVAFFPQLLAGPIERAGRLLKQFEERKTFDYQNCVLGLRLILWGLFKKIVLADNLAQLVDVIFNPDNIPSGGITLLGGVLFAFQIYGDFSGYSDMAIGLSKMLGFNLMRNFMVPYSSSSFTEFWRRWHVSLSSWFKEYVYIPLGGNEKGNGRTKINILITFLLSGMWHGAQLTFLIWGALHGFFLIIEKTIHFKTSHFLKAFLVFVLTALLWISFRAENFKHLKQLVYTLKSYKGFWEEINTKLLPVLSPVKALSVAFVLVIFLIIDRKLKEINFDDWLQTKPKVFRYGLYYMFLGSILVLGNFNIKPSFIYFQF